MIEQSLTEIIFIYLQGIKSVNQSIHYSQKHGKLHEK